MVVESYFFPAKNSFLSVFLGKMTYAQRIPPKIVIICGPTALGKTSFSIDLAKIFKGEIINADSMQIYRYMDIGTAKPTPEEQASIRSGQIWTWHPSSTSLSRCAVPPRLATGPGGLGLRMLP